ncbi:MgtC/SapB transporter [Thalassoporum mexicanum PCC 7367]|uniref:MgtC/SapB family protein n=1 Tax=Thalassoporum mexicanum TaxID=3457544 RepID=UPI00029FA913|nr:MgtC/SapB family protein [Pseudanabaena sp. PCC 7367]AFY69469.1 MgtC/SapB transporter [Pseudanabaena sp. PCC 7367]
MESLAILGWLGLTQRLGCSLLVGGIVGWERESARHAAGLRTHLLVSLGAALFVVIPIESGILIAHPEALSRIIQGVATGVGFIGAGTIVGKSKVHGITTAADIWVTAALGLAAGCGLVALSLIGAMLMWFILRVLRRLEANI